MIKYFIIEDLSLHYLQKIFHKLTFLETIIFYSVLLRYILQQKSDFSKPDFCFKYSMFVYKRGPHTNHLVRQPLLR